MEKKKKFYSMLKKRFNPSGINYLQYFRLRLLRAIGRKSLRIETGNICTTGDIITIGCDYHYREGGRIERVRLLDIRFRKFFLHARLYFIDHERIITCTHLMCNAGYMGMWRLWDNNHFDLEEYRRNMEDIDYEALDSLPVIYV